MSKKQSNPPPPKGAVKPPLPPDPPRPYATGGITHPKEVLVGETANTDVWPMPSDDCGAMMQLRTLNKIVEGLRLKTIRAMHVRPGDKIIVSLPMKVRAETLEKIREQFVPIFPGHQIIVLEEGITIGIRRSKGKG